MFAFDTANIRRIISSTKSQNGPKGLNARFEGRSAETEGQKAFLEGRKFYSIHDRYNTE